jgi:SAM-dependent methyltransferase
MIELEVFPPHCISTDAQITALWESKFFHLILQDVLEFYPPGTLDITAQLPPPRKANSPFEFGNWPELFRDPYWKVAIFQTFPEIYLDPFLSSCISKTLIGCDIACGWGRAALTLRNYHNKHVYCCDVSTQSLCRLQQLADSAGLRGKVTTVRCSVTELPLPNSYFDYFLAFDILEHLSNPSITKVLQEILRCAKSGAILYTEIPLNAYCPAITHIQDFSLDDILELFGGISFYGRHFKLKYLTPDFPSHFSFIVQ